MTRGAPFALKNGKSWRNKTAAKEHFSEMLNRYSVGAKVSSEVDHADLLVLVTAYDAVAPEWKGVKTGLGVDHFIKDNDDEPSRMPYGKPCFYVVRVDGSRAHFSTNKAVDALAQ